MPYEVTILQTLIPSHLAPHTMHLELLLRSEIQGRLLKSAACSWCYHCTDDQGE